MALDRPYSFQHDSLEVRACFLRVDEVTDILLRRNPHHDAEPMTQRGIEERARRHGVRNPQGIDAAGFHLCEIAFDLIYVAIFSLFRIGPEGAIVNALSVKLFLPNEEKSSGHAGPVVQSAGVYAFRPRGRG